MPLDATFPRVFVSYARGDGAAIAADLRRRLAAEGVSLWQDLVAMEGGQDWWRRIQAAVDKAEYVILVLTPGALASETCRREWRYARQVGTYVVPVSDVPPDELDLARLAGWMRRADIVHLGTEAPTHGECGVVMSDGRTAAGRRAKDPRPGPGARGPRNGPAQRA